MHGVGAKKIAWQRVSYRIKTEQMVLTNLVPAIEF